MRSQPSRYILQANEFTLHATELFGGENGCKEGPTGGRALPLCGLPPRVAPYQHGDDVFEFLVLRQGPPDFLAML